ncbi:MAG TPA: glucose 1-dehydrogenase [Hyphomicrobiaceae bacterium]|nr:glucose 1-dehydrogenase [Hyphomicrobiaceae bacterium]
MFDLKGKVALVTGGNGGIGLGMAQGLADAGADVVIAARKAEKSKAAAAALAKRGVRTAVVEVNVADEGSCRAMVAEAAKQMGRIDILVNNAGINIRKPPETYSVSEWRDILSINLDGAFYCSQAVYPEMKKAGGGKIINIGSMMSLFGAPLTVAYAASKGGIVQMTRGLATAWAKDNIQVNSILPGWIDTELTQRARVDIEGLNESVLARTPAGRWGKPEDFSGIAVFLASPASDFVTGTAIPVCGGFSIRG